MNPLSSKTKGARHLQRCRTPLCLNGKRAAILLQVRDPFVPFVFCDDGAIIADCAKSASPFWQFLRKLCHSMCFAYESNVFCGSNIRFLMNGLICRKRPRSRTAVRPVLPSGQAALWSVRQSPPMVWAGPARRICPRRSGGTAAVPALRRGNGR